MVWLKKASLIEEAKKYDSFKDFENSLNLTEQSNDNRIVSELKVDIDIEKFGDVIELPEVETNSQAISNWEQKISNGERPIIYVGGAFLRLIDGNNRLQAYKNLGFKKVPVVFQLDLENIWNESYNNKEVNIMSWLKKAEGKYSETHGEYKFIWRGGTGISVVINDGNDTDVDYFNLTPKDSSGKITIDEVKKGIKEYAEDMDKEASMNKKAEGKYSETHNGLKFVWNGGRTINIYDEDGTEVDVSSLGDYSKKPNVSEVKQVIKRYLQSHDVEASMNKKAKTDEVLIVTNRQVEANNEHLSEEWADSQGEDLTQARQLQAEGNLYYGYITYALDYATTYAMDAQEVFVDRDFDIILFTESTIFKKENNERVMEYTN